ncbi:unnamed protein product [Lepeophtheirus salmonis]|uniref:(salmon louse) hypothetical protein n=1 Tax=Lepeophtheirus salmonis TaxID=72036 RepID=A0A7R8CC82_LEPSM|nr:unnamed protein product [Lepeophtheirus salmonis]CAF2760976.1 unnamed protein product [Lepeophtheirus salmonis]
MSNKYFKYTLVLLSSLIQIGDFKKVMVVTSLDEFSEDMKVLELFDFETLKWRSVEKSDSPAPLSAAYRAESLKPGTARLVENHAVLEYELKNGLSLELARYSEDVMGSATLEYGDTLCIVGGYDSSKKSLKNEVLYSGSWVALPPMNVGRHQPGAVVMDGKLYVAGGYDTKTHKFISSVEVFDDITQRWYQMAPMNHARAGLRLINSKGKLYAIGGWRKRDYLSVVEEYDPFTDSWSEVSNMNIPRARGKKGFRQSDELRSMEKYTPSEDKWSTENLPEMPHIRGPTMATLVNDF